MCIACLVQALATLKQKVKKYNKDFEDSVVHCRANPDLYEEEEEERVEEETKEEKGGCGLGTSRVRQKLELEF